MKLSERDIGGKSLGLAAVIWLSVSVGPWWLGIILFMAAWIVNLAIKVSEK
jgi:hypothetical protein